jgi:transcriptional regulator with XRE-family HTH domain
VSVAEQFGRNLRQARRRVDLTQQETAARAGLHRTEIGLLENGNRVARIDTLAELTKTLEVSADELMAGIEWMPPPPTRPGKFRESGR